MRIQTMIFYQKYAELLKLALQVILLFLPMTQFAFCSSLLLVFRFLKCYAMFVFYQELSS